MFLLQTPRTLVKLFDATLEKREPLHRQISNHIRSLIATGELVPGSQLPSTHVLAAKWQTGPQTVHLALVALEKEGLLTRRHGKGTFVRQREKKLTCVGMFDVVAANESLYALALHKALKEELQQAGIEMDVWLDPRPEEQFAEPWQPFMHAARQREFQAVIVIGSHGPLAHWQSKLPVPTAFQAPPNLPTSAGWDFEQFVEVSVEALAQQGCRSVGVIVADVGTRPHGSPSAFAPFYQRLMDRLCDRAVTTKAGWRRTFSGDLSGATRQERFGHEEFLRLWKQSERPDGLIVYPDTTARGVISGLLEQQVRVPQDLKLVLHKNEAVDLHCPLPATFVVSSERRLAQALIAQVQKQFRGESCEQISIPFDVVSNAGR